jgi:hypothetical protein
MLPAGSRRRRLIGVVPPEQYLRRYHIAQLDQATITADEYFQRIVDFRFL